MLPVTEEEYQQLVESRHRSKLRKNCMRLFERHRFDGYDAIKGFIADGDRPHPSVVAWLNKGGHFTVEKVEGGTIHRKPYLGKRYNKRFLTLEAGGWGSVWCWACEGEIVAGEHYWLANGPKFMACDVCMAKMVSMATGG